MKIVAMYLPQYHRVPENDEWWGDGFTDWDAVKRAKPIFDGQQQPRIPLNKWYYDLLDKDTMVRQSDLMKEYGIDGICIYHYWFKDGRKILEKPAENLLEWKDLDMPFCFYWANESWARSWSGLSDANTWADTFEQNSNRTGANVLLEQQYGRKHEWKEHFDYLLPFFMDERYIRIDDKPVFMIYRSDLIPCLAPMLSYWRELACQNGLKGIYLIGAKTEKAISFGFDAGFSHEPVRARVHLDKEKLNGFAARSHNYDEIWEDIIEYSPDGKTFFGGFVSYDDTPRRGKKGYFIEGFSLQKFENYLSKLINKNASHGNEITFINAWNEWGEGMYLEPDEISGYGILEAVRNAKSKSIHLVVKDRIAPVKVNDPKETPMVSVVVPAYNLADYIADCIYSIIGQSYRNLEIIIVDDGSKDNTVDICKELQLNDDRVFIEEIKHAGVVAARQHGIERASGQYILMVDGDDWIDPDMIEKLVTRMVDSDMVSCGVRQEVRKGVFYHINNYFEKSEYDGDAEMGEIFRRMMYDIENERQLPLTPWIYNKLFRKDLLLEVHSKIDKSMSYAEDLVAAYSYVLRCKSVRFIDEVLYHYRYREGSALHRVEDNALSKVNTLYNALRKEFNDMDPQYHLMQQLQQHIKILSMMAINNDMGFNHQIRYRQFVVDTNGLPQDGIVLYGAGVMGEDLFFQLSGLGYKIVAWADKRVFGTRKNGFEIIRPELIADMKYRTVLIAVSNKDVAEEIKRELTEMGINDERIMWRSPVSLMSPGEKRWIIE